MPDAKERVKAKLSAVGKDLKDSKIRIRINGIEKIDGKLKADFGVSGLPTKKESFSDSYRDIPKIFDSWAELSTYADKFFSMTDAELAKLCETE